MRRPLGRAGASTGRADTAEAGEAEVVERIAQGDRSAFELLYRAYFPRLTRFLGRMTRSSLLIEEILNDTMLVVWQKARSYDLSCKVSTWIFAIAYRKALKAIKFADDPDGSDVDLLEGEPTDEPEHEAMAEEMQRAVTSALDTLPLEQRTVVQLTYYSGMSYEEIATIMDCPVNTVKTRMFHARRRLKSLLFERIGDDRERTHF